LDNTIKPEKCANHESLTNRWKIIISGKEQVEMFADAIEAFANNRPKRVPVSAREITDEAELIEFMKNDRIQYNLLDHRASDLVQ
jgi:hypothetical protein